jgi:hypothetical protein
MPFYFHACGQYTTLTTHPLEQQKSAHYVEVLSLGVAMLYWELSFEPLSHPWVYEVKIVFEVLEGDRVEALCLDC